MFDIMFLVLIGILIGLLIRLFLNRSKAATAVANKIEAAKNKAIDQTALVLRRWIQLGWHISAIEPAVFGNTPPESLVLKVGFYNDRGDIHCECRGITIQLLLHEGIAWAHCADRAVKDVEVDLKREIPASKITELTAFFAAKKKAMKNW